MDKFKVNDKVVITEDIYEEYEHDWLQVAAGTEGIITFKDDGPYNYYVGIRDEHDGELDTYSITDEKMELVGTIEARQAMYRHYEASYKELRSVWISSRQSMIIASDMMDKARQDLKERGEWDE